MKRYCYIFMYAFVLLLCSCKAEKVTQRIMGAGDCQTCYGWSWNNGVASTTRNYYDDTNSFSFKVTVAGELSFEYKSTSTDYALLKVSIDGKMYFQEGETGSSYTSASLGMVQVGEVVTFFGRRYKVKDIKIVGEAVSPNKSGTEESDDQGWDF